MPAQILVDFLYWFFVSIPLSVLDATKIAILAVSHFFSLKINFLTLFEPWKNERRKGFEMTARGIGMTVKLFTISVNLILVTVIAAFGALILIAWFLVPFLILLS